MNPSRETPPLDPIPDSLGQNLYVVDSDLRRLLALYLEPELLRHLEPHLHRLGALVGGKMDQLAWIADRKPPELVVRTRQGHDCSVIVKNPAYIELERYGFSEFGLSAAAHVPGVLGWHAPLPQIAKYTLFYLFTQAEFGLTCPLNVTDSLTRTLKKHGNPELVERYFSSLTSLDFDKYAQGGMFMTEQGIGSDIARTATMAKRNGDGWALYGDKWFCSNPSADLIMVLARPEGAPEGMAGVSLFLMPRIKRDGQINDYRIVRLKDKLGTRSLASGEARLEGAEAYLIGEIGRGFQQMAEMVNSSRLSNGIRSSGLMRRALSEALFVAQNRYAFGKRLMDLPLMQRQLEKMALPTEQGRSFGFQTAQAMQRADAGDEQARRLLRIMTPIIKFRACRDARTVTADGLEVRGGCGAIEEWAEARLVRESMIGSIWEGTSNIVALDVFRATRREQALPALSDHLHGLLQAVPDSAAKKAVAARLELAIPFANDAARARQDALAREVASMLYHASCAAIFLWESSHPNLAHRLKYCHAVMEHRLDPQMRRLGLLQNQ